MRANCVSGLNPKMPVDSIPSDIGDRVQKIQRFSGFGSEQWRRYLVYLAGGHDDPRMTRDPRRMDRGCCFKFVSSMAQGHFLPKKFASDEGGKGVGGSGWGSGRDKGKGQGPQADATKGKGPQAASSWDNAGSPPPQLPHQAFSLCRHRDRDGWACG